jgi:hypothetical protein
LINTCHYLTIIITSLGPIIRINKSYSQIGLHPALSAAIPEDSELPSGSPIPFHAKSTPRLAAIGKLASKTTTQRLSLISRHLDQSLPLPDLNTPFSTERASFLPDDIEYKPIDLSIPLLNPLPEPTPIMSAQAPHNTLLIPGPIEFDDAVLQSMSHYA